MLIIIGEIYLYYKLTNLNEFPLSDSAKTEEHVDHWNIIDICTSKAL